mgnify:CR=1 FL=1
MEPDRWLGVELRHLAALQAVYERDTTLYYEDGYQQYADWGETIRTAAIGLTNWVEVDTHADLARTSPDATRPCPILRATGGFSSSRSWTRTARAPDSIDFCPRLPMLPGRSPSGLEAIAGERARHDSGYALARDRVAVRHRARARGGGATAVVGPPRARRPLRSGVSARRLASAARLGHDARYGQ